MSSKTPLLFAAVTAVSTPTAPAEDTPALDQAFTALPSYDSGSSRGALMPIDNAVRDGVGNAAAPNKLEQRLAALLLTKMSPVAKEYICSKLGLIGSAESVPALAGMLPDPDLHHIARNALEAMPCPEAVQALRESLPRLRGRQKAGVVSSLGTRRDPLSVPVLGKLLADSDAEIAGAAATALGHIGTIEAVHTLQQFLPNAPDPVRLAVADGCLAGAERLLRDGKKAEAQTMYRALADSQQPKHVRLAVERGLISAPLTK